MSSHEQYSPVLPIDESTRHDSNRTSQDSSDGIELKNVQVSGETAVLFTSAPIASSHGSHEQVFNSNEQTRRLFFRQFVRWLGTVGFVALILVTLKIFESKKNFSHKSKYILNTIFTALSLGLGLNFFVSLNIECEVRPLTNDFWCRKRSKTLRRSYDGEYWPIGGTAFEKLT